MRVLVVEDEPKMTALVARGLREEGHAADVASRGKDALWMAGADDYLLKPFSDVAIVLPRSPDPAPSVRTEPKQLAQRS
jgi:DNA-binding response OmpR family regulator